MTACSSLCMCYNSVVNCAGAETRTLEITHKLKISATTLCDERNKYILAQSFTFTPHRQKSRTIHHQEIQYCSDQKFDLLFAPTDSTPGLALSIEISCSPKWLLGFLEKDLLSPEDSSFSLGIQLGTYIYNRRWNNAPINVKPEGRGSGNPGEFDCDVYHQGGDFDRTSCIWSFNFKE